MSATVSDQADYTATVSTEPNMNTYTLGSQVTVKVTFNGPNGLVDPDAVFLETRAPDGTMQTLRYLANGEITRLSLGKYQCVLTPAQAETWFYKWYGEGFGQAADEGKFRIRDVIGTQGSQ